MDLATPAPSAAPSPLARLVGKPLFWAALVALLFGLPLLRALAMPEAAPPPVLGTLPAFSLTSAEGRPFGTAELSGKVWVANLIFTRCPTICPLFTRRMAQVQHRGKNLGERFHLVSFSVDPEHDTPEVLARYAHEHRASPRRWTFLTGEKEALARVVVDGLKVHMTKDWDGDDLMALGHGTHFVLVDGRQRVRGYYDSADPERLDALLRDASLVIAESD
jgi:protein SCO1/2